MRDMDITQRPVRPPRVELTAPEQAARELMEALGEYKAPCPPALLASLLRTAP